MRRTQELQCRSSSKSVNCRDSSVSFPYRVGPILVSHSHVIPWALPKKPVTIQISDCHGPGKMRHHMLLWQRWPQHHQYHCVLIWGSCLAALGMSGETKLLRESGQEWRETEGKKKRNLMMSLFWCHLQGEYPVCILLQTMVVNTFSLQSKLLLLAQHQDSCQKLWDRQGQLISGYWSTSIRWCFPNML